MKILWWLISIAIAVSQGPMLPSLFVPQESAGSYPTFVQYNCVNGACQKTTATTAQTFTWTTGNTAGNWVTAAISWHTSSRTILWVCSGTSCTQATTTAIWFPYTQAVTNGAGTASQIWICPNCPAETTMTVEFSGTTVADEQVWETSNVSSVGQVNPTNTLTGTSTAPAITITTDDANDMVVAAMSSIGTAGVASINTGTLAGASRSGTTSSFDSGAGCYNTASAAGTAVKCQWTITSEVWTAQAVEYRSAKATDAKFVQSIAANTPASAETATPTAIYMPLVDAIYPAGILSGNSAICDFSYPATASISSVVTTNTLNGSTVDTFTLGKSLTGTNQKLSEYYVNATAGAQYLTITFGAAMAASNFTYTCTEKEGNVSAVDEASGTASEAGPYLTAGALGSLGASGDWIHLAAFPDAAPYGFNQGTGYCSIGVGGFFLDAVNGTSGSCTESMVYGSTASINPAISWPSGPNLSTASTNVLAVAYESSTSGTAPSGIYVSNETQWFNEGAAYTYGNCPSKGNMLTATTSQWQNPGALQDSNQDATTNNNPDVGNFGVLSYATNSALDNSSMCRWRHVGAGNDEELIRDVVGAATTSPLDTMSTACPSPSTYYATGCTNFPGTVTGSNAHQPDIQPTATNELVINAVILGTGPESALTAPTNATMICGYYTNMLDASALCSGNGHSAYVTNGANPALNFTWTNVNSTYPGAVAWAIKP